MMSNNSPAFFNYYSISDIVFNIRFSAYSTIAFVLIVVFKKFYILVLYYPENDTEICLIVCLTFSCAIKRSIIL
jgi:hypothetical protein